MRSRTSGSCPWEGSGESVDRYLLVRNDGFYVADLSRSGGASYTPRLEHARLYPTREAALGDACSNEYVTTVDDVLERRR